MEVKEEGEVDVVVANLEHENIDPEEVIARLETFQDEGEEFGAEGKRSMSMSVSPPPTSFSSSTLYYDDESEKYKGRSLLSHDDDRTHLSNLLQRLCLVRLSWPGHEDDNDNDDDVDDDGDDDDDDDDDAIARSLPEQGQFFFKTLPPGYYVISDKEKVLFWHAENFRKQFRTIYPDRKPLLLVCENECGVQKFVSTTIRRSIVPYPELSTWRGCAKFVSDYLIYEPPKSPLIMPKQIRSPSWLTNFQRGNSFEYSTFLVSLLLGQGYDAYVVSGYASREQASCDLRRIECRYLPKTETEDDQKDSVDSTENVFGYNLKPPPDFRSKFFMRMEESELLKSKEEEKRQEEERLKEIRNSERPPPDKYFGFRIHSWVVILSKKFGPREEEVRKPFFIEPSTGVSYDLQDRGTNSLYLGVESIWNNENYWVNMQMCNDGCSALNWDLSNTQYWEHLLPGESSTLGADNENSGDKEEERTRILAEKHLDIVSMSYVREIDIHPLDYERRYPNGAKTLYYKKSKVELFAPYVQTDGLVQRLTVYEDYHYQNPIKIHEKYSYRMDKFLESRKNLIDNSVVDFYGRGRPDACKEHRYFSTGHNSVKDDERTLRFYDVVRFDGLSEMKMTAFHIMQDFVGRDDFLYSRYVEYEVEKGTGSRSEIHQRKIWKIVEKFHRNPRVEASRDIETREFAVGENEIRLKYHYERGNATRATRTFIKPPPMERGDHLLFDSKLTHGYNPDPMADREEKKFELFMELTRQLSAEEQSILCIRESEFEIGKFLKKRVVEFFMPQLSVSLFDRNRNEEAKAQMFAREKLLKDQSRREAEKDIDYLSPYLARLGNPKQLTRDQALQLKQECIEDYKKMTLQRANNILREFETYTMELQKIQDTLKDVEGLTRDEQEYLLTESNEMNFKLHVLEIQLNRYKTVVPDRFRNFLETLAQNPIFDD